MTVNQFRRRFRTERDCLKYLIKRKWPHGFCCPRCGHARAYIIESRKIYQCAHCRHQTSVTANTIFHKTRKPLRDWFWAIFLVATRTTGSSARQIQHDLGLSYQTAWTWCHKIRKAMADRNTRYQLRGVLEVDDAYLGGRRKPGKRGRGARSKVPVLVAVESRPEGCGHAALRRVPSISAAQVKSFLQQKVRAEARLFSDGLSSYHAVSRELPVWPVTVGAGATAVEVFPDVHRVIANLKSWIRGTHTHVSGKHLDRYLAEFAYRFNRRFKQRRITIFDRLVSACCVNPAITYRQLVAELNG
jgi:transposase-like protein